MGGFARPGRRRTRDTLSWRSSPRMRSRPLGPLGMMSLLWEPLVPLFGLSLVPASVVEKALARGNGKKKIEERYFFARLFRLLLCLLDGCSAVHAKYSVILRTPHRFIKQRPRPSCLMQAFATCLPEARSFLRRRRFRSLSLLLPCVTWHAVLSGYDARRRICRRRAERSGRRGQDGNALEDGGASSGSRDKSMLPGRGVPHRGVLLRRLRTVGKSLVGSRG